MRKERFFEYMEKNYGEIKDKGISTDQLINHIERSFSLPQEEGWLVLENLLSEFGLTEIQRIPQCYGYELSVYGDEGVRLQVDFDERYQPKVTLMMFDQGGHPLGYREKIFRNPQDIGSWLKQTIREFRRIVHCTSGRKTTRLKETGKVNWEVDQRV